MCPTPCYSKPLDSQRQQLPVDRCWGLPVLGAITTLIVCLPASYMGLLFVFFIEDYGYSRALASWPQNVLIVGSQLSGLVVSELQQHFGVANIGVLSCILASIALIAAAFSRNVVWVSVTLGAFYGLGMGMFLTCVCVHSLMLFCKYRGTATSLIFVAWSVSGVYAPAVLTLLRECYGLQGSLLISGAVLLHAVPLSMLLRNPLALRLNFIETLSSRIWIRTATKRKYEPAQTGKPFLDERSAVGLDCAGDHMNDCPLETPRGSLTNQVQSITAVYKSSANSSHLQKRGASFTTPVNTDSREPYSVLKASTILLRFPAFYAFLFATVVGEYSLMAFAMTVVDYTTDKGVELSIATHLVMFGAVGQILGRIFMVPLSDCIPSTRCLLFAGAFVIEALCTAAMPHVFSVPTIVALRMTETAVQGSAIAVRGILLARYVGIETITTCTGLFGLVLIPVSISSASVIGHFRDSMGSYDGFYRLLAGANIAVATGLFLFFAVDWRKARRRHLSHAPDLSC